MALPGLRLPRIDLIAQRFHRDHVAHGRRFHVRSRGEIEFERPRLAFDFELECDAIRQSVRGHDARVPALMRSREREIVRAHVQARVAGTRDGTC